MTATRTRTGGLRMWTATYPTDLRCFSQSNGNINAGATAEAAWNGLTCRSFHALKLLKTWTVKVNVPHRKKSPSDPPKGEFRRRYDDLERRREHLLARLRLLGQFGVKHAAYSNAQTLLGKNFRKAKLAQRVAVLEAAAWFIDLLEKLTIVT